MSQCTYSKTIALKLSSNIIHIQTSQKHTNTKKIHKKKHKQLNHGTICATVQDNNL